MKIYQVAVQAWFEQNKWSYWHPFSQSARLIEELGELARALNDKYGEKPRKDSEEKQELLNEVGDVLYTLICLANSQGLDLRRPKKVTDHDAKKPPLAILLLLGKACGKLCDVVESGESTLEVGVKAGNMISVLMSLAIATGIDLDTAIQLSISKVKKRDKDRYK